MGLVRAPLRRARRRRAARASPGTAASCPPYARTGEVDTVDGFVLALSPWVGAQRALRRVARAAARLRLRLLPAGPRGRAQGRHRGPQGRSTTTRSTSSATPTPGSRPTCAWRRSGTGRMPGVGAAGGTGRQRARRAEAEAAAARAQAVSSQLQSEARKRGCGASSTRSTGSTSWRLTEPLRRLNALRRRAARLTPVARRARARISSLRDDRRVGGDPRAMAQAREPLGQRERARVQQPPQHRLLARGARLRLRGRTSW